MRFQGKKMLVTGAASGIGRATAILFAAKAHRSPLAISMKLVLRKPQA